VLRLLLLITAACSCFQAAVPVSIQMQDGEFIVAGWTPPAAAPAAGWSSIFAVYAGSGDVPPLLGRYSTDSGTLRFRPRYTLAPGLRIRAVFRGATTFFDIPREDLTPTTRVERVYPTAATLPENQLKFYIEFSAPMGRGHAWKHLSLLNEQDKPIELPFLEIEEEMWDAEGRRLTVLFDPGRIKRGVKPLEDIGPAIESGGRYTLVVGREWQDARGSHLVEAHRKPFRVTDADRTPIDTAAWRIRPVRAGTSEPLVIDFPEPLEAALAQRLIWVAGMRGRVELGHEERQWRLYPDKAWTAGEYRLQVDTALEDLAGNKVGRPFEVDLFDNVSRRVEREVISIPLTVAGR
jgi:hypothetical protein